jgi:2-polyprenyl-3-methyl-5-hydroxy-6-metoxy-1,4-benzoquinol methylase
MDKIFKSYVEYSFDGSGQAAFKLAQFDFNYKKLLPSKLKVRSLDIGVGRGEMLSCMKAWNCDYYGIDISSSTINLCQQFDLNCELVESSQGWLSDKKGCFDFVTCLDVLEHVPRNEVIDFLAAIYDSLAKGGVAIIQVPNLQSPFGYIHHFNDFTHVNGFVEHSLSQVLRASGCNNFRLYGFEEIYKNNFRSTVKKILRAMYRNGIRLLRWVNMNPNPKILDPVFYAVIKK